MFDDKIGILDIKAKVDNSINYNIEMQIVDKKNIEKRILYYWSKMYTSSIKAGIDYSELEKSVVILLTDYNIENLQKIKDYITKWNIREEKNPKIILTDVLEIYIIELGKVNKNLLQSENILNIWLQFINNPGVISKMENKEIKQARKVLQDISNDEHERFLAELRQKYIMDQKAVKDFGFDQGLKQGMQEGLEEGLKQGMQEGLEEGLKQGMQEGLEKGIKQGLQEAQKQVAKKLKEKNIDIQTIIEATGLTKEEIEKL